MPQNLNPKKPDLTVSLGIALKDRLLAACEEDDRSASEAVREAIRKWLAARDRKVRRQKEGGIEHQVK